MLKKLAAICLVAVAACGPLPLPEKFNMPMVTILRMPDGSETVMNGQIIPKMDFSADFEMASASGIKCVGKTNNKGEGKLTCDNGWPTIPFNIPRKQYGKPDGAYTNLQDGVGVAVGWGKSADANLLRGMF